SRGPLRGRVHVRPSGQLYQADGFRASTKERPPGGWTPRIGRHQVVEGVGGVGRSEAAAHGATWPRTPPQRASRPRAAQYSIWYFLACLRRISSTWLSKPSLALFFLSSASFLAMKSERFLSSSTASLLNSPRRLSNLS